MVETLFWVILGAIIYTYIGYTFLLIFMEKINKTVIKKDEVYPTISMIIAAHNEEIGIKDKLENTSKLNYPKEKLEVIVASDASTDKTNQIVEEYSGSLSVKLLSYPEHKGKTFVQNEAVKEAKGSIIVFSDATTKYDSELLKNIIRNFADSRVGAVGGELVYVNKGRTSIGDGNGFYWRYEKFLKRKESQIASLIGVSGCCYAVRKELYEPISTDIISDFVIAQIVYKKGKLVVYEPEAVSYEETNDTTKDEFNMRVRVSTRTLNGLWSMRSLLNPFKYGFYAIQLISHKILRYLVPIFLILFFIFNFMLYIKKANPFYNLMFYLQVAFYICSFAGAFTIKKKTILSIPFYFTFTNVALLWGLINFLRGEKQAVWSPFRSKE